MSPEPTKITKANAIAKETIQARESLIPGPVTRTIV